MPLTEKKKTSNAKWDAANLKRMSLAIPLELFEKMQSHVSGTGESINGFIKRAISETVKRDFEAHNKCDNTHTQVHTIDDEEEETIADDVADLINHFDDIAHSVGLDSILKANEEAEGH